jgi:hypothetical protein
MALIGKSASQRNLCKLQFAAVQERLRSGNADATYIFTDGAVEMVVKLATDLDRMSANKTGDFRKCQARVFLFSQHFSYVQQPSRSGLATRRRVLSTGQYQQELQRYSLDVQQRHVISTAELAVKARAQSRRGWVSEFAG